VVVDFNFRFSTESTADELKQVVETVLRKHQLDFSVKWTLGGLPFLTTPGNLLGVVQQAIQAETGIDTELSTSGGTSDARFIAPNMPPSHRAGPPQ
jgi:succinyl-diaminopimelate desuccinylase